MSVVEFLLRVLSELKPLLLCMTTAVALTAAALVFLLLYSRNVWVDSRRFRLAGLFFGMNGRCSLRLACVWLKLIFLLITGGISALCAEGVKGRLGSLLWLLLQLAGLVSVNLICGFIRDMAGSGGFILIYVAMGLFLILFSVYLFLNELNSISMQRDVDAEALWDRSEN